MTLDELFLRAKMIDLDREVQRSARRAALRETPPVRPGAPAGRRIQRLLAELYGPNRAPGADPALFSRLAWTGLDE